MLDLRTLLMVWSLSPMSSGCPLWNSTEPEAEECYSAWGATGAHCLPGQFYDDDCASYVAQLEAEQASCEEGCELSVEVITCEPSTVTCVTEDLEDGLYHDSTVTYTCE